MILSILPAPRRCREVGPAHSFIRSLGHYLPRDWPPRCQEACWLWGRLSREKRSSLVLETLSFKGRQTTARRRGALRAGTEAWGGAGGGSPAETPDQHRSGRASRRRRQASHYCAVPVHVEPPAWHQPSCPVILRPQGAGAKEEDATPSPAWVGKLWLSAARRFNVFPMSPERGHVI